VANATQLSLHYLQAHPLDAARVLQRVPPREVAVLLAELPSWAAAPALRAMLPLQVARCLETLEDDAAAGLLRALGPQSSVAIMHYVPEARRERLLAQLPTAVALAFRVLLGYPEDAVGAWMNPRVLVLPQDLDVAAALERLRAGDDEVDSGVFVIDAAQHLVGVITTAALVRASAAVPLSQLAQTAAYSLPARAPVRAVERHTGWNLQQVLPVVERNGSFVGVLDRAALARALARNRQASTADSSGDAAAAVAAGFWVGVSSLIELSVALLPAARPRSTEPAHER